LGAPLTTIDVEGDAARELYEFDLVLVRPDLHVVWRGNEIGGPDATQIARVATGNSASKS
jgi:hypothetical protein